MSEGERENKLLHSPSETLEYLIHGHWSPTEFHVNGRFGAWWVDMDYILGSGVDEMELINKLDLFEDAQRRIRNEAIADAKQRAAEPATAKR